MSLKVDVISDVVCPWCFIGKRRLEQALNAWPQRHADIAVAVHWHPFELNPEMPVSGMNRRDYIEMKFGGPRRAREVYSRVEAAGREVDIQFNFASIELQPNTVDSHRLIAFAARYQRQPEIVEALFRAYFLEGQDLTQRETLEQLSTHAGLDRRAVQEYLKSNDGIDQVKSDEASAQQIGVQGVPFFIFNGRLAVSGAQPADVLLQAMEQAVANAAAVNA